MVTVTMVNFGRFATLINNLFFKNKCFFSSTRRRSWLMHCTTSRKDARSIPYGVNGIFYLHIPSGRTRTLRPNQDSNRNEYQKYFLEVKAAGA